MEIRRIYKMRGWGICGVDQWNYIFFFNFIRCGFCSMGVQSSFKVLLDRVFN